MEYVESGNVEAAIVAWPLVSDRGGVLLPANLHDPIRQTGGIVKTSKNPVAAHRFLEFLLSPEGRRLLESHGYSK
jgi:molybdate transport system substrate-binding protein